MSNPNQTNVRPSSSTDAGGTSATLLSSKSRLAAKSPHATLLNGIPDSWSEQTTLALACPICFDTFSQPQVTKCGHTFCNDYIRKHIENQSRFPKCTVRLSKDDLTPTFAMNELIILGKKSKSIKLDPQGSSSLNCSSDLRDSLLSLSNPVSSFSVYDVDILMAVLLRKKETFTGGNARGGGRGGYNRGSQLIDYVNRSDQYCPWCGYVIFDSSLERPTQCPNTMCLRLLPMSRPMSNGFMRCPRCWRLTHHSFLVCEACGRQRPAHEVHLNSVNVQGLDPMFVNVQPQPPGPPIDMGNDPEVD
ncbi:unnamed protein product, partial [Allacma fusca]